MDKMRIIPKDRDTEKYLNAVEAEAFRILDSHALPHQPGVLVQMIINRELKHTLGTYQALSILENIQFARGHLKHGRSEMLSFSLSAIRDVMHMSDSSKVLGSIGGKKGRPPTALTRALRNITYPDADSTEIINILDGYKDDYIDAESINQNKFCYWDKLRGKECAITTKKLREKINKLKKD